VNPESVESLAIPRSIGNGSVIPFHSNCNKLVTARSTAFGGPLSEFGGVTASLSVAPRRYDLFWICGCTCDTNFLPIDRDKNCKPEKAKDLVGNVTIMAETATRRGRFVNMASYNLSSDVESNKITMLITGICEISLHTGMVRE